MSVSLHLETPPPGVQSTEVNLPPTSPTSLEQNTTPATTANDKKSDKEVQAANQKEKLDKKRAEEMAANCKKASKYLRELQSKVRIRLTDLTGQMRIMSPEEKAQEVEHTQEMVRKYCVKGP